jgi:hypothetical protein
VLVACEVGIRSRQLSGKFLKEKSISRINSSKVGGSKCIQLEFEVLTDVVMSIYMYCDTKPCTSLKVKRRFGGICRLRLQDRIISQVKYQHKS